MSWIEIVRSARPQPLPVHRRVAALAAVGAFGVLLALATPREFGPPAATALVAALAALAGTLSLWSP